MSLDGQLSRVADCHLPEAGRGGTAGEERERESKRYRQRDTLERKRHRKEGEKREIDGER